MNSAASQEKQTSRAVCLPPGWPWFGVIAVLPFALAAIALEFVAPTGLDVELYRGALARSPAAAISHMGDRLTYATMAYVQFASALIVIGIYVHQYIQLDPARRAGVWRLLLVTVLSVAIPVFFVRHLELSAYIVTYVDVRDMLRLAKFTHDFTMPFTGETTRLSLISDPPFIFGALAVMFAVPVGAAAASFPKEEPQDWKRELAERVHSLQRAFYALSIVLVTSTLALMLFLQLPAQIAESAFRAELFRFAHGLTLFWGATMTLTLIAIFAPAMIALRQYAKQLHGTVASSTNFGEWFSDHLPTTARRQIANLGAMLAPLLVGPLGSLVQTVFASG